jgi:hypothetical protein
MEKNPCATTSTIVLVVNKTLFNHELFVLSETTTMKLQGTNFHGLLDRFSTFVSPNIKNFVLAFRHGLRDMAHWITFLS